MSSCAFQQPTSIVSYNHLGNNDGKNLSAPQQFRSKEISKSNVVDDMVQSNHILYQPGEKPDHCVSNLGDGEIMAFSPAYEEKRSGFITISALFQVVIKYVPYVGDSKRAMDEYTSEIMMGGTNTIAMHNTCEVSNYLQTSSAASSVTSICKRNAVESCSSLSHCSSLVPENYS